MASINKVIIIGNLGRDPEVSYTQSGLAIAKLSVATKESWKDKASGETKDHTEWHRVIFFGKLADVCGKYLVKGSSVYVLGKLKTTSYEKDGITRYQTDIHGSVIQMLSGKPKQDQPNQNQHVQEHRNNTGKNQDFYPFQSGGFIPPDDDIPF